MTYWLTGIRITENALILTKWENVTRKRLEMNGLYKHASEFLAHSDLMNHVKTQVNAGLVTVVLRQFWRQ